MILAALACAGCVSGEVDGTWRHPVDDEPSAGPAYELALGQYGPEVAGLVRLFQATTPGGDAYARPLHCAWLEGGEVTGGVLRFRFKDTEGVEFSASLDVAAERLFGLFEGADRVNDATFERIDAGIDKDCDGRTEKVTLHGSVLGADLDPDLRVGLFYTGVEESGRFWVPRNIVGLDPGASTFTIEINRLPDPKMLSVALTDGSLRFAYALFIAFIDEDGDGAWDREVLGNETAEPLVGVAPDHALAFLEGRGSAVFPDRPRLLEELAQNYNLVSVVRAEDGEITALLPVDPAVTPVHVRVPADRSAGPFLAED